MIQLELAGRRYAVSGGEFAIGSDADCAMRLEGEGVLPRHAVVQGLEGGAAIRAAVAGADVQVNGVRLGTDPTPILHGDKLTVAGREILVVDAGRVGSTQMMQAISVPAVPAPAPSAAPAAAPSTGGRLVCLTDGREYEVGAGGLVFGRDAGNDVVVTGNEVSRRHAEIHPTPGGYVLTDASANGTFVNGERVQGTRVLRRGDVLRVGPDEFRFYADQAPAAPVPATPPPVIEPPPGAEHRLNVTLHGVPATPLPFPAAVTPAAPLAALLVRSGALKGKRLLIRTPVVNIGRADYNDVVLPEPSVSTAHAKLQRREGVWVIVDLGSTNGTAVDGEPVRDEMELAPGATIRLGEVTLLFEPKDAAMDAPAPGTRVMRKVELPGERAPAPPPPPALRAEAPAPPPPPPPRAPEPARPTAPSRPLTRPRTVVAGKAEGGFPWWVLLVLAAGGAGAYYYFFLR